MLTKTRRAEKRRGQSETEYIIIVVLVAIAVLAGVLLFGKTIEEKYMGSDVEVDTHLDTNAK